MFKRKESLHFQEETPRRKLLKKPRATSRQKPRKRMAATIATQDVCYSERMLCGDTPYSSQSSEYRERCSFGNINQSDCFYIAHNAGLYRGGSKTYPEEQEGLSQP